jgi:hypothetical protein
MPFLSRLAVMFAGTPDVMAQPNWVLLEPLRYQDKTGTIHEVPATFTTDLSSVPRLPLAFAVYGNRGQAVRPSVVHDFYCRTKKIPRKKADKLFLEAMLDEGMPEHDAKAMYAAVAAFTASGAWKNG